MAVSVRELQAHLSAYLRRVATGEEFAITSRGRLVARLAPPTSKDAAITRIQALPFLASGKSGKPEAAKRPVKIIRGQKMLAEIVIEGRN